ncbi:MAG: hypothetical protein KDA66_08545 [Planctomycetaceae bacterium]|nr:hypothetical protein [Planctomycetaceae bacterium]
MGGNPHQDLYQRTREDLLKRQLSNNENFDRSILTLSSAGLALSITFMRSITSHDWFVCLVFSWIGFVTAIIVTIVSYLTSQKGISKQLELAERYYLRGNADALTERNFWAEWTDRLALISASAFVAGILLLLLFFSLNLPANGKATHMSPHNEPHRPGTTGVPNDLPRVSDQLKAGATIPSMQIIPMDGRGASVPPMQPTTPKADGPSTTQRPNPGSASGQPQ